MAISAVLSPRALETSGYTQSEEPLVCSIMIGMLSDFVRCAVLYVDDKGQIVSRLRAAVAQWPEKFRKRGLELISQLDKRSRFVRCGGVTPRGSCLQTDCRDCVGLVDDRSPRAAIASDVCYSRICDDLAAVHSCEVVNVAQYPLSVLSSVRTTTFSRVLLNGEWNQFQFEQEILIPLFRDAKHVKIIDRYIGRTMFKKGVAGVSPKYEFNLNWIADCFARSATANKNARTILRARVREAGEH